MVQTALQRSSGRKRKVTWRITIRCSKQTQTQGWNPGLLYWQVGFLPLAPPGSPCCPTGCFHTVSSLDNSSSWPSLSPVFHRAGEGGLEKWFIPGNRPRELKHTNCEFLFGLSFGGLWVPILTFFCLDSLSMHLKSAYFCTVSTPLSFWVIFKICHSWEE